MPCNLALRAPADEGGIVRNQREWDIQHAVPGDEELVEMLDRCRCWAPGGMVRGRAVIPFRIAAPEWDGVEFLEAACKASEIFRIAAHDDVKVVGFDFSTEKRQNV